MEIKKFDKYSINEGKASKASKLDGEFTLYRLVSNVLDLSAPGEFYVYGKSNLDTKFLKKDKKDLFVVAVKCDSKNIDIDKSEKECAKFNNDNIVAVKSEDKCELVSVQPFNK